MKYLLRPLDSDCPDRWFDTNNINDLARLGGWDDDVVYVAGTAYHAPMSEMMNETKHTPDLLAACETLWSELKNKLASIDVHTGFPFEDDSPCTVYFLDRIVNCATMTEGIAKCDELMAEEFPDVYAAIAAAKGE